MSEESASSVKAAWSRGSAAVLVFAVLLGTLSSVLWGQFLGPVGDDYSQIASGRHAMESGAVTGTDPISWTSDEIEPVTVHHEWLYQVTAAKLHDWGGFGAMEGFLGLVRLGIFALLAAIAYRRSRRPWAAAGAVMVTGALLAVLQTRVDLLLVFPSRPQTLSILLLLAVFLLLDHGGKARLAVLPLLVLGANWHGGFWPLYALVVGYFAVRDREWRLPLLLGALLLTPEGTRVLAMPFAYAGGAETYGTTVANEWARTVFWPGAPDGIVPFLLFIVLLAGIHLGRPRKADLGLLAALMLLALAGQRFVIFPAVLGIPVLAGYWDRMEERILGEGGRWASSVPIVLVFLAFVLPVLTTSSLALQSYAMSSPATPGNLAIAASRQEADGVLAYVEDNRLERVMNTSISMGDYMAFKGVRPFIYNRTDVFEFRQADGSSVWSDFYAGRGYPATLDMLVDKYDPEYVLDEGVSGYAEHLASTPDRYREVFASGKTVLYEVLGGGEAGE